VSATQARRALAAASMKKAHNESALLMAILTETADLTSRNHWTLRQKLQRLRTLAETIRDTGSPALATGHPSIGVSTLDVTNIPGGISSFDGLRVDETPNTHLDNQED
jgi:hypothetical protein